MKHFILVLSIVLFVLTFLHPSIIEDASFNNNYLCNLRRSDIDYKTYSLHGNKIHGISTPIIIPIETPRQITGQKSSKNIETNINLVPYTVLLLILLILIIVYTKYKMD
jgi:hypothetical protein